MKIVGVISMTRAEWKSIIELAVRCPTPATFELAELQDELKANRDLLDAIKTVSVYDSILPNKDTLK